MPVFIIMFRILTGLTYKPTGAAQPIANAVFRAAETTPPDDLGFVPRYISNSSELFESLSAQGRFDKTEMVSFGIDLAITPIDALSKGLGTGLVYALLVVALAALYFLQQRMVAARAAVSPTMSPAQQKLMQYLPVVFAIFQVFFLAGLIIYYMAQAVLRIGQQAYITKRFYGHEESLGRQAQRAGDEARELAKQDGGGSGMFGQPKGPTKADAAKAGPSGKPGSPGQPRTTSKRTTPPKGRPTPSGKTPTGPRTTSSSRPSGSKSSGKRRR
jgi:YidC/Oxa1 family membrane protein insertase